MEQNFSPEEQEAATENEKIEEPKPQQKPESRSSMEDLLEGEGIGLDFPHQGEIRKGTVARITESEVLISIGTKSEGVIPSREVEQLDPEFREELSIGKEITVYVVNPEDQNGNVLLSYQRALEEEDWQFAESLLASNETYEGKIIGFNKGGLIIPVGQLRGFLPASQVSLLRRLDSGGTTPEQRWGSMVDESLTVSVIEVDRERRRLILSERAALQETRESLKERLLDELSEGDVRTGRVTSLADFGAFVNIEGADGLVHLSEISWERIEHPREVLRVGQEVDVKVIGIDHERKRIGLSIRQLQEDPWIKRVDDLKEGQLVEGTITHLTKFGAFARLDEDLEGLIHISEISEQRVAHPKEVLHEGDVVTLRVIKIEPERHRIGLSLRKVDSPAYTDFDWKTTLAEVVEETHGEDEGVAVGTEEIVEEIPVTEEVSAEVEEPMEEDGEPIEPEALAEEIIVAEEVSAEAEEPMEENGEPIEPEDLAEEIIVAEEVSSEAEEHMEEDKGETSGLEALAEEITVAEEVSTETEEPMEEDKGETSEPEASVEELIVEEEIIAEVEGELPQVEDSGEVVEGAEDIPPEDELDVGEEEKIEDEANSESGSKE
jgi:small subunit ribosomal protein S1